MITLIYKLILEIKLLRETTTQLNDDITIIKTDIELLRETTTQLDDIDNYNIRITSGYDIMSIYIDGRTYNVSLSRTSKQTINIDECIKLTNLFKKIKNINLNLTLYIRKDDTKYYIQILESLLNNSHMPNIDIEIQSQRIQNPVGEYNNIVFFCKSNLSKIGEFNYKYI
jgi:hypothetical protein